MHKDYCQCPRCASARRTKKLGLGIGIPAAVVIAAFFVLPNFTNLTNPVVSKAADLVSSGAPPVNDQPIDKPATNEPEIVMPEPEQEPLIKVPKLIFEKPTLQKLREHALKKINEDRARFNLSPVELSDNEAAQVHAEDVLKTREISHWMTNGEKPYMTYTRLGGEGSVGQNVGLSGDMDYYRDCTSGFYLCDRMDPFEEIDGHQYGMMYEDEECCDNGHRDNILEPQHTHVSIGIAYDAYTFVIVQNFEDNYIGLIAPVTTDHENIQLTGRIKSGYQLNVINIFYDELPTPTIYETNYMRTSYDSGSMIAGVAPPGSYFEEIETIQASNWYEKNDFIDIRFSLEGIADKDGVYTIVAWLGNEDGESFPTTSYSVFID